MDPREDARAGQDGAAEQVSAGDARALGRRRLRWSEAAWVAILVAIGVVQIVRAQWFDAIVYGVAVGALLADATGLLPAVPARRRMPLRWLVAGAAALGAVMCFAPRHGVVMGAAVLVAGAVALVLAWPQPGTGAVGPWPRGLRRLAIAWSAILVAGCLWELAQFILGRAAPRLQWFALSDLIDPVVATVPGRILFAAAWTAAGVFLLRRGRRS